MRSGRKGRVVPACTSGLLHPEESVRSSEHKNPLWAEMPTHLQPPPLGLQYLSSSTWMVSCLYLHFTRLRIQLGGYTLFAKDF